MKPSTTSLTIGQAAKQAGVSVQTVRYYERLGLIPEPPRLPSGYRSYPPEVVKWVRFIKNAQKLGFSLDEISQLLISRVEFDPDDARGVIKGYAEKKVAELEAQIAELERKKATLLKLAAVCGKPESGNTNPIASLLSSLDADENLKDIV